MLTINEKPKRLLTSWVWEQVSDYDILAVYDPFSGNAAMSSFSKRRGLQVFASDVLQAHYYWNKALVENNGVVISQARVTAFNALQMDIPAVLNLYMAWGG